MGLDRRVEGLPEPYRSDFQQCIQKAFNEMVAAQIEGRTLSIRNASRVFSRHWYTSLDDAPEQIKSDLLQSGHKKTIVMLQQAQWYGISRGA